MFRHIKRFRFVFSPHTRTIFWVKIFSIPTDDFVMSLLEELAR
jgi:hypothetical protein